MTPSLKHQNGRARILLRGYGRVMEASEVPSQADLARDIEGPFVATFTARLPFPVVVPDGLAHTFLLSLPFTDPEALEHFSAGPFVTIRFYEQARPGLPMWPLGTHAAIKHFYQAQLNGDPDERWGADIVIERDQWITLETPHTPVVGEEPEADRGYAFHRCMRVLDLFMQAMLIITKDERMRPISAHDFRPVMIIGAVPIGKPWRHVSDMLMFPNVPADATIGSDKPFTEIELNNALSAILTDRPYLTAMLWRTRAQCHVD